MKKILSLLLVATLFISMLSTSVIAASTNENSHLTYKLQNERIIITGIDENFIGDLVIPETIDGFPVTEISSYAFEYCQSILSVTIPDTITVIGYGAFCCCDNLVEVYISDLNSWCNINFHSADANPLCYGTKLYLNGSLVTNLVIPEGTSQINDYAFYNYKKITSLEIPNTVTSIGASAFYDSSSITQLTIPDSVTSIGASAFYSCSSLESLDLGKNISTIGYNAFSYCNLNKVSIPESITFIGSYAFSNNNSIKIEISSIEAWCKITFDDAIASPLNLYLNNQPLTDISIPEGIQIIQPAAFSDCKTLKTVTFPNSLVIISDYAFSECINLESVSFSDGLEIINNSAFSNCTKLTDIVIPKNVSKVSEYAFYGCTGLEHLSVHPDNTTYHSIDNCIIETDTKTLQKGIKTSHIPSDGSVTTIGEFAFYGCDGLRRIDIPYGIKTLGYYSFGRCKDLINIEIPDSVTTIDNAAFAECTSLTGITLPNGLTTLQQFVFDECNIVNISIPKSMTEIMYASLHYCSSIENVYYAGSEADKALMEIGNNNGMLPYATWHYNTCNTHVYDCDCDTTCNECGFERYSVYAYENPCDEFCSLCSMPNPSPHLYDNRTDTICNSCGFERTIRGTTGDCTWTLSGSTLTISGNGGTPDYAGGEEAPWGTAITRVIIEEGVTSLGSYQSNAFYDCTNLTSVSLPNTLTHIGDGSFSGCTNLEEIIIPNSVEYIGDSAFKNCSKLKSIKIPSHISSLSYSTFENCSALSTVYWDVISSIGKDAFSGCSALTDIWCGNADQESICIYDGNEALLTANWHYGSCTKNPDPGNHVIENNQCIYCNRKVFPIVSIQFDTDTVHIVENSCGSYDYDIGYHIYELENYNKIPEFTATLIDGRTVHSTYGSIHVNGETFDFVTDAWDKQFKNQWESNNTYEVTCNLYGYDSKYLEHLPISATLQVKIIENPIERIDINDITLIKNIDGYYYDEDIFYYGIPTLTAKITYTNGATETISGSLDLYSEEFHIETNAFELQYDNPWDIGTYQVTGTLLGVSDTFNVTIKNCTHKYSHACDTECNICDYTRTVNHSYKTTTTKATLSKDGSTVKKCTVCGKIASKITIKRVKTIKLSSTSYTYNGKTITPSVVITDSAGKNLKKDTDYTVSYEKGRKNVGTYKVTIKLKGKYSGTKSLTFKINPPKTALSKLTPGKNSITVSFGKKTTQVTGYQIQYSTSKTFSNATTKTISSNKTTKYTFKKLKAKKKYYVRVRTYKTVGKTKYYSSWSSYKSTTTK